MERTSEWIKNTEWDGPGQKSTKIHSSATVVCTQAVALPDGAGIVSPALSVLWYTHLIWCGWRWIKHSARCIHAVFVSGFCGATVLLVTVGQPRNTRWDRGFSEAALPIHKSAHSTGDHWSGIFKQWAQRSRPKLKSSIFLLCRAPWNTTIAWEYPLPAQI